MRYIILLLLAAACGYGVMQIDNIDPDNYVKMYLGNYVIEIKVLGFLLLTIAAVVVLYLLISLLRKLWKAPASFSNWRKRKSSDKADEALGSGYLSLIKGDWKRAEKLLTSKSEHSKLPYINYLAAAQAAQEQGRMAQRDDYLNAAYKAAPKERLAIGLTKARLHQTAGQMDAALATLEDIELIGRKNPQYTAMLMQTHEQMENWEGVQDLMPTAKKQAALPSDLLKQMNDKFYTAHLASADDVDNVWRSLPRDQKKLPDNVLLYAGQLINKGEGATAEKLIRSALKSSWSDGLVRLYGSLESAKPAKLRRRVEGWLLARPEDAELNLAAGRFAMREENYDLAIEYLEASIKNGRLAAAYSLLGDAYEASGDSGKALRLYRDGMLALSHDAENEIISPSLVLAENSKAESSVTAKEEGADSEQKASIEAAKEGQLVANS